MFSMEEHGSSTRSDKRANPPPECHCQNYFRVFVFYFSAETIQEAGDVIPFFLPGNFLEDTEVRVRYHKFLRMI
jgi:hypothetical protein